MPLDPDTERVAEAIYDAHRDSGLAGDDLYTNCNIPPAWYWLNQADQATYRDMADAAINAHLATWGHTRLPKPTTPASTMES